MPNMTPEERKQYNKQYYQKNRAQILEKALTRVHCELCSREVVSSRLERHQASKLCYNRQKKQYDIGQRIRALEARFNITPSNPE